MSGFTQSIATSSRNYRGNKRKWVPKEDDALVVCMIDLHNVGTFNVDMGLKTDYLNELEIMLEKIVPRAMLKARHNLESSIKTWKKDWAIVYDILKGKDNSGFGWDEHRHMVVAQDAVWNSYISSHKETDQFRHNSFLIMTNLLLYMQKIEPLGKMLKKLLIFLKK
ncbi:hypothetical protein J1N35_021055 [Gossypium stocksii]|uniref:Myb/SANT-like domain-containing protein n=1 Tax=Gossypium stocksii TaxID=47602 RepID=A0A9D4A225_9ROSI|nr:hypothetical protein J1N35_021055 [Gossypium stocksii]